MKAPVRLWATIGAGAAAFVGLAGFVGLVAALDVLPLLAFVVIAVAYMVLSAGGRTAQGRPPRRLSHGDPPP